MRIPTKDTKRRIWGENSTTFSRSQQKIFFPQKHFLGLSISTNSQVSPLAKILIFLHFIPVHENEKIDPTEQHKIKVFVSTGRSPLAENEKFLWNAQNYLIFLLIFVVFLIHCWMKRKERKKEGKLALIMMMLTGSAAWWTHKWGTKFSFSLFSFNLTRGVKRLDGNFLFLILKFL